MTTDKQSKTMPNVAYTVLRFALGGIIGCIALATTLKLGGMPALTAGPIAFFAGTFWAAGELHLGLRGRLGFDLAAMITLFFSFMVHVGTQAAHGDENFFLVVALPFVGCNLIGGVLGLFVIFPGNVRPFKYAVFGFAIGSIVAGLILAVEMATHLLNFNRGLPLIPIPGIAGGTAAAWALRSKRRPVPEPSQ